MLMFLKNAYFFKMHNNSFIFRVKYDLDSKRSLAWRDEWLKRGV